MESDAQATDTITIAGVRLTHPTRILYPGQGATKLDLAEYYLCVAHRMLSHLKNRPISLVRCPKGRDGECFFQKHHNASTPEELRTVHIKNKSGKEEPYIFIGDETGLVAAAQIGALELHLWGARKDRIEKPERIIFDLDPDEGKSFKDVRAAAFEIRDVLASLGLQSFAMLTGGKGVHIIAPIERRREWPDVKLFCKGLALKLQETAPDRYVAIMSKEKRKDKIFIDWLRNERGATAIAPYSPRARPGAPVATPVSWDELKSIDSAARFTLDTISNRLSSLKSDPWADYFTIRQSITKAMLDAAGSG